MLAALNSHLGDYLVLSLLIGMVATLKKSDLLFLVINWDFPLLSWLYEELHEVET